MTKSIPFEQIPCLLCGGSQLKSVHHGPDYYEKVPGMFSLVQCKQCGLIYQNPRPTREVIGMFYPDNYAPYSNAQSGLRARKGLLGWVTRRGMNARCQQIDAAVKPQSKAPRRLLDVGTGGGLFLEAMQGMKGWQVEGLEPNAAAAQATSARLGVPVFAGGLEDAKYPDASFDAVTLWDVLEHLYDPLASLRDLRRMLKPGGAIFIRVPNASSYVRRLTGRYWVGYDQPRHTVVFSPKTLRRALHEAGFTQIKRQYTSGSYLYLIHSLRFALDDGRVTSQRAAAIHRRLYHPISRMLLMPPMLLADRMFGGSALEVLALAGA